MMPKVTIRLAISQDGWIDLVIDGLQLDRHPREYQAGMGDAVRQIEAILRSVPELKRLQLSSAQSQ